MNNNEVRKNNNNTKYIIVIILLVLALIGVITYMLLSNDNKDNKGKNNNTNIKDKMKEATDIDKEEIVRLIDNYNYSFSELYPVDSVNEFPNQKKLEFLYKKLDNVWDGFTAKQLEEVANKYFTSDFSFNNEDISCPHGVIFKYNPETSTYTRTDLLGHGEDGFLSKAYFVDAKYNNDLYEVTVKTLYYYCSDICFVTEVYGSPNKDDVVYDTMPADGDSIDPDIAYNKIKDKVKTTTYTFIKKDNNYLLKSVK